MKLKILFLFGITFFSFAMKQESKDMINWDENRPLTWDDFKGKPQKRFAAASTSYDILKSVSKATVNSATVKIQTVFFCEKSWKKGNWISASILMHEQKHFDIVEIYSRRLRKALKERRYSSLADLNEKADSLYAVNDKELDAYQDRYDDESDGSMDGDKQREWNTKVINELKSLSAYSSPTLSVSFR